MDVNAVATITITALKCKQIVDFYGVNQQQHKFLKEQKPVKLIHFIGPILKIYCRS